MAFHQYYASRFQPFGELVLKNQTGASAVIHKGKNVQGGMTWLGWAMGIHFSNYITDFDHWIAFVLLSYLGGKMVYESFKEEDSHLITFSSRMLFTLGVATSIDALAVGVSMAFLKTGIWFPASVIAFTTFFLSFSGVICGFRFGKIKGLKVELLGGLILIVIGVKILIEHTLLD